MTTRLPDVGYFADTPRAMSCWRNKPSSSARRLLSLTSDGRFLLRVLGTSSSESLSDLHHRGRNISTMRYHANAGKVLDAQHVWIDIDVHGLGCFLEPVLIVLVLFMVMLRLFDRLGDLHSLLEFGKEPRFDLEFWQLSAWW